jgi:hypothetical protein
MYLTADWEYRRWEKAQRYYEAHIHQDLWGEWVLTRVWGRRGTLLGRTIHVPALLTGRPASGLLSFTYGGKRGVILAAR